MFRADVTQHTGEGPAAKGDALRVTRGAVAPGDQRHDLVHHAVHVRIEPPARPATPHCEQAARSRYARAAQRDAGKATASTAVARNGMMIAA